MDSSEANANLHEPGPAVQEEPIRVLAAVIHHDGRWLVCQRPPNKRHGGLWEFPGGKLEPAESLLDAARREMAEELGLEATAVGRTLASIRDPGSPYLIEFVEVEVRGAARPLEHSELRWATIEVLAGLPLAPSDREFAALLRSGLHRG
ncbi:MAG: (deoxy)nucleoside triphosphate pyrophosphohydrolase [Gemmatimonadales bacterium]